MKHQILFYIFNCVIICHGLPDIRHINVNDVCQSAVFSLIELMFFSKSLDVTTPLPPPPKTSHLFYCNCLDIWHDFPDSRHNKVNNDLQSTIFNSMELFFSGRIPSGLVIWHSSPDIRHIKVYLTYLRQINEQICTKELFLIHHDYRKRCLFYLCQ